MRTPAWWVASFPSHGGFNFSEFAARQGVSGSVAAAAAEETFVQFCARAAIDGVITDKEQSDIAALAEMLEIPAQQARQLLDRAKQAVYQRQYQQAQADGVITAEEEQSLRQLRTSLGLAPAAAVAGTAASSSEPSIPAAPLPGGSSLKTFGKSLVYRSAGPPERIQQELSELKDLDKAAEKDQKFWLTIGVAAIVIGIFSLIGTFAAGMPALLVGVALGVGGAIAGFAMKAVRGRFNVDDRRYTLVWELARYLGTDMAPDSPLDVTIDFNSYQNRRYLTDQTGGGMFSSTSASSYCLPWLTLKGALADGSRFRLAVTQVVKRKERRKRKYTKVKEAFREKISLALLVKAKRYANLERIEGLMDGAQLPPGIQLRRVSGSGNRVTVHALTDCHRRVKGRGGYAQSKDADRRTSSHHTMLGLFLACYHCLAQCRRRKAI